MILSKYNNNNKCIKYILPIRTFLYFKMAKGCLPMKTFSQILLRTCTLKCN